MHCVAKAIHARSVIPHDASIPTLKAVVQRSQSAGDPAPYEQNLFLYINRPDRSLSSHIIVMNKRRDVLAAGRGASQSLGRGVSMFVMHRDKLRGFPPSTEGNATQLLKGQYLQN